MQLKKNGMTTFEVRNNSQLFYAQTLSIVYGQVSSANRSKNTFRIFFELIVIFHCSQRCVLSVFLDFIGNIEKCAERDVLERIASLYGANLILRHIGLFFEVNFIFAAIE